MSLFVNLTDKLISSKVRIKKILVIILFFFPVMTAFDFFNKKNQTKILNTPVNIPSYNFTPTPTMTPVPYPQLFYFKTKINQNLKFPDLDTRYILSGNNDNNYKYWYVLITTPASDDITFISYMYEMAEKAIVFESIGNNTKNARYNFVRGLLK